MEWQRAGGLVTCVKWRTDAVNVFFDELSGRLHFSNKGHEAVLLPWPVMRAFRRSSRYSDWHAFEPQDLRVELAPDLTQLTDAQNGFTRFTASVPLALLQLITHYPDGHWVLLAWAARCGPVADDLLVANPCLAYMLARVSGFSAGPESQPPAWATRPYSSQKSILGRLGFPATDQMRRAAYKVLHSAMSVPRLVLLRQTLKREPTVLERLSHLRRINANVLVATYAGGTQVTAHLLSQLSATSHDDPAAPLGTAIADTIRGWRVLRPRAVLPVFDQVASVRQLHEQIIQELRDYKGSGVTEFPPPPIRGTDTILPLSCVRDLVAEGREQHNCVASYARQARSRQVALYKVLAPQRATLSLSRRGLVWAISELKGTCNRPVSGNTWEAVRAWLAEGGESAVAESDPWIGRDGLLL